MSLEKFNIDGSKKKGGSVALRCSSCRDGQIFLSRAYVRSQKYESLSEEKICGCCNTKYMFPRKDADKIIDENCMSCSYGGGTLCSNMEAEVLCFGNEKKFFSEEFKKLSVGDGKMDLAYAVQLQEFKSTGKCSKHVLIVSDPLKTFEGVFKIESCRVCKRGRLNYNGKIYEDNLMNLIDFLAHRGVEAEKKSQLKEIEMSSLLGVEKQKSVSLKKLFGLSSGFGSPSFPKFNLSDAFVKTVKDSKEELIKKFSFV